MKSGGGVKCEGMVNDGEREDRNDSVESGVIQNEDIDDGGEVCINEENEEEEEEDIGDNEEEGSEVVSSTGLNVSDPF